MWINWFLLPLLLIVKVSTSAENSTVVKGNIFGDEPLQNINVVETVQDLVHQLTNRLKCEQFNLERSSCESCLRTDRILELLQIETRQTSLSREEVVGLSVIFLHHLLHFPELCTAEPQGCYDFSWCRDQVFSQMGSSESLQSALQRISDVLKPTQSNECFSSESILSEVTDSSSIIDEDRVELTITILMKHIFFGQCIIAGDSLSDFLDDIFHMYGDKCSTIIHMNGLKKMMHDLQSNGIHHDHNGNNHKGHDHSHGGNGHNHDGHDHNHDCEHQSHTHHPNDHFEHDHDHDHSHDHDYDHDHSHKPGDDHSHQVKQVPLNQSENHSENSNVINATSEESLVPDNLGDMSNRSATKDVFDVANSELSILNVTNESNNTSWFVLKVEKLALGTDLIASSGSHRSLPQQSEKLDPSNALFLLHEDEQSQNLLHQHQMASSASEEDAHRHTSLASKCLSVEDLMSRFGRSSNNSLSKEEFTQLCPAIVQQIVSGVCKTPLAQRQNPPTNLELYGYSTLAVFLISLTSLAGVVLLPIIAKQAYYYVMAGCIGLAFSTLTGDALLHLIPQAIGVHSHGEEDHDDDEPIDPIFWKQLTIFAAIYLLYLFESILCAFSKHKHHSHHGQNGHSHIPDALPKELTLVSIKVKSDSSAQLAMTPERSSSLDTEIAETNSVQKPKHNMLSAPSFCGLSTVALLVTIGDSIHNFGDGLAIGAAFSSSIRSGLSTSIAVFCHELPHEFGDFVILLSSGLSFSKALWLNFASAMTCLIGLYIGIQIGFNESARTAILSITAGIFLYVALTEMLPELKENKRGDPKKMLLVKNLGIILGVTIMALIAVYEHKFDL